MKHIHIAAAIALAGVPALTASPVAAEAGDWLVRARAIMVAPTESSSGILPDAPTGEVSVDNAIMPELDFTYFITDNIAAELILATTNHDISGAAALDGAGKLADTWVLPPTLTVQYHFLPDYSIRPYIGAGINYTIFYSEDGSATLDGALGGPTDVSLDSSFGWALQAGVDVDITEKVFINFDVKYIDINTTATLTSNRGEGGIAVNEVDVALDPLVIGIGFGIRF